MRHRAVALAGAFLSGLLGLSFEVIWVRAFSFVTGGTSPSFGVVLGVFLLGLCGGALLAAAACRGRVPGDPRALRLAGLLLLLGSLAGWATIPGLAWAVRVATFPKALPLVALSSALLGSVMPLLAHVALEPDRGAGAGVSRLYVANIAGSVGGTLLTGFVLLDRVPMQRLAPSLALAGLVVAGFLVLAAPGRAWRTVALAAAAGAAALVVAASPKAYGALWERLERKSAWKPGDRFALVIENRAGVTTVTRDGVVSGGGAYDGVISTELREDRNGIVRAYAASAVHPAPRRALLVGLASGSWAQVLANMPQLEHLTILEINPGCIDLVARYPAVASVLRNPRAHLVLDDARRWLRAHPGERFDVVLQNTSFHWRGHMADLLSSEYLSLVRSRLAPGGVFLFNTTDDLGAKRTACTVYPYGLRFRNYMIVSDAPVAFDTVRWRAALLAWRIDGRPVLDLARAGDAEALERVLATARPGPPERGYRTLYFEPCASVLHWTEKSALVTDDNGAPEWYRPWWAVPESH